MSVRVNGEVCASAGGKTVATLLEDLGYESRFVAVAINKVCILRADFSSMLVRDGDELEVLAPMAGG